MAADEGLAWQPGTRGPGQLLTHLGPSRCRIPLPTWGRSGMGSTHMAPSTAEGPVLAPRTTARISRGLVLPSGPSRPAHVWPGGTSDSDPIPSLCLRCQSPHKAVNKPGATRTPNCSRSHDRAQGVHPALLCTTVSSGVLPTMGPSNCPVGEWVSSRGRTDPRESGLCLCSAHTRAGTHGCERPL